jgi:hypothetical protein
MITAKEFLKRHEWTEDYEEILREFAILHVEAALKAASEKGQVEIEMCMGQRTGVCWVDEDSILNSYPLTNIK